MPDNMDVRPHFILGQTGVAEPFTSPSTGGDGGKTVPPQNRQQHATYLNNQLQSLVGQQEAIRVEAEGFDLESAIGIQIEFESFPDIELAVASLADERQKIELLNVVHRDDKTFATVFVPEGKLSVFENKIQAYLEERTDKAGRPRDNRKLIDAIQSFRRAAVEALWSDAQDQFPGDGAIIWWEVWLPIRQNRDAVLRDFTRLARGAGMAVSERALHFPERSILLARGTKGQLSQSGLLLNTVSELRRAKETAAFFDEMPMAEQHEWAQELLGRLVQIPGGDDTPYVCVLDTGVNSGHPLLAPFIDANDQTTVDMNWGVADGDGHGTGMAGLAVWRDLTEALESGAEIRVNHRIESVKVLRHSGDNQGKHLGLVTADGVSTAVIANPERTRVYSMALSSKDGRDRGRPSAWSSEVDSLTVDYLGEGEIPKLFVVCAGNAGENLNAISDYPNHNLIQDIHDPGQSWNALTIGAYTDRYQVTGEAAEAYKPLAPPGGLSPYSTTSMTWNKHTPIKPEVVFEGGNIGRDQYGCASLPSLSLLTTHYQPVERLFTPMNATSAATALAGNFAAEVLAQYPGLWPETVRALMVHSAEWTNEMVNQFNHGTTPRAQAQHRVRCVGFGVPNIDRALWSLNNSLSLIVEDALYPFEKRNGRIVTRDMHLHDLPWPRESLEALGETEVEMAVTLSYFIEPNPSNRRVSGKYSYQSHNLRFDVKRPLESVDDFRKRINRQARAEEEGSGGGPADPDWLLGSQFRHKGSIHKDVWKGKAVELAERGQLSIYPAMGWWRTRTKLERYDKAARYSLVVSIAVPGVEVDIYTEVLNQVEIATAVEV